MLYSWAHFCRRQKPSSSGWWWKRAVCALPPPCARRAKRGRCRARLRPPAAACGGLRVPVCVRPRKSAMRFCGAYRLTALRAAVHGTLTGETACGFAGRAPLRRFAARVSALPSRALTYLLSPHCAKSAVGGHA
ncbi:MAG: hypothetical protein Pg6A_14970 [Termitinemataceae bacterium]|nr:MAG: hypothetical protein Pg6A_14970 [Termitinemataceae bacterium]